MESAKVQKIFFYIMLLIMAASIAVPGIRFILSKAPEAVNGTLDLTNWKAEKDEAVPLNGEWEFYFGKLLSPGDFKNNQLMNKTIQKVPSDWSKYKIDGKNLPVYGIATYRIKILLPGNKSTYGIKITCIFASAKIFADDQLILTCGNPGETAETTRHGYYGDTAYFNTDGKEVELLVQVANFAYMRSGIGYTIYFGSQQSVNALWMYNFFIDTVLIAGMFFISLYFGGLGLQRAKNPDVIYFALYCLFFAIHESTRSEAVLNHAFPAVTFDMSVKILTLSFILCLYSVIKFVYHAVQVSFSRSVKMILDGIVLFFVLLTCFTDFYFWKYSLILSIIVNLIFISFVLGIIFKHIHSNKSKVEGRYYLYTAVVSSVLLLLSSLSNVVLLVESNFFIPVFQPVFVLSLALYMSEKYENSYKTIERLSGRLSTLDKLKDDFFAKTSHELKTPLNGIINISQSLLDGAGGSLNTAQAEDIRLIASIGRRLSTLVHDILDYSRLKILDIKLNITCIDVHQVVESTVEIFRYLVKRKPVAIENRIPPDVYMVMADENRLKQIISNLLDNAVKYAHEGAITIDCRSEGDFVFIEVRDTGAGIPESRLKDIFISYEQLDPLSSNATGTGLGLSITRQLVELHHGRIYAESEPGKGSCFTFSIPLGKKEKEVNPESIKINNAFLAELPSVPVSLPFTSDIGGEFSILAVDDEYSNLKSLLNILTVCKYNVTIAGDAESALRLLEGTLKYDLCILDVIMPGMSGYEACRKIREIYSPLELPILMLTAKALPEDMETGFMSGANDFLEKPFEVGELKGRANTLVQLKKSKNLLLEKETAFLQAQIRPHFLFNALNTISSFCYTNPDKAGELLAELGVFLRNSFDFNSTFSFIPIEKEIRIVKAYAAIEKARFGGKLEIEYNIDATVLKYSILPLIIQPIVENSIRHGLMKRDRGGKVTLNLTFYEGRINIQVIDNGIGIPAGLLEDLKNSNAESKGVGLTNISRRLLNFYNAALDISSAANHGTAVSFSIPANEI